MRKAPIRFSDDSLEGQLHRLEQAFVDADIEGIPADPEGEALLRDMAVRGISGDACIARIKEYLATKRARTLAAE